MIGLKRRTVDVVPYRAEWAQLFLDEKARIMAAIGELIVDIQHVGSTAVPELAAKPILDIAIAVEDDRVMPAITRGLEQIGYIDRGNGGRHGGYLFVKECAPDVRTHHVHIVSRDDAQWRHYLGFRDLLRRDERLRIQYMAVKQALRHQYSKHRAACIRQESTHVLHTPCSSSHRRR